MRSGFILTFIQMTGNSIVTDINLVIMKCWPNLMWLQPGVYRDNYCSLRADRKSEILGSVTQAR